MSSNKAQLLEPPSPQDSKPLSRTGSNGSLIEALDYATVKQRLLDPAAPRSLDVGACIRRGWRLFTEHSGAYLLWSLLTIALSIAAGAAGAAVKPEFAQLAANASQVLYFPLFVGPFVAASNSLRANGPGFRASDLFLTPFKYYIPLLAINTLTSIAVGAGFTLLFLPGLYLALTLSFSANVYMEYHEHGIGLIDALRVSLRASHRAFWDVVLLSLASAGVLLLGAVCAGVGVLVAMPVVVLAWAVAFDQLLGMNAEFGGRPERCVCCC